MQEQNLPTPITPEAPRTPELQQPPQQESAERPSPLEKLDAGAARGDAASQNAPALPATNLPQPVVPTVPVASSDGLIVDTPTVADDVNLIEKVWVEKAKTIVKQTKTDPYQQEKQVGMLQKDYQGKRYGKKDNG
jgi:hypothetical protein